MMQCFINPHTATRTEGGPTSTQTASGKLARSQVPAVPLRPHKACGLARTECPGPESGGHPGDFPLQPPVPLTETPRTQRWQDACQGEEG